jgi:hypothetical protein
MADHRLGDVIDDHCIKCRRVTNHSIVSIVDAEAAKVRCRTCYHDHDYRHEIAPPSKKDLKKAELFKEVLAGVAPVELLTEGVAGDSVEPAIDPAEVVPVEPDTKKPKTRGKKAGAVDSHGTIASQ